MAGPVAQRALPKNFFLSGENTKRKGKGKKKELDTLRVLFCDAPDTLRGYSCGAGVLVVTPLAVRCTIRLTVHSRALSAPRPPYPKDVGRS